jgi:hypothetical protein
MNLTNEQKNKVTIVFRTANGQPALVSTPSWVSSDESVVTIQPAANGLDAYIFGENNGSATVTVSANADLKGGTRIVSNSFTVMVENAEAQTLEFIFDAPELK